MPICKGLPSLKQSPYYLPNWSFLVLSHCLNEKPEKVTAELIKFNWQGGTKRYKLPFYTL